MNLKRIMLSEKFNDENGVIQFRWINSTINNDNLCFNQHSWKKEIINDLVTFLLQTNQLSINICQLENYYQDREKIWWVSNEGVKGGYLLLDQLSYTIQSTQSKDAIMTVYIQKRKELENTAATMPNTRVMERSYKSKRYHMVIYLSGNIALHITYPITNNNGLCQLWLEMPIKTVQNEYGEIELWNKQIYSLLSQLKQQGITEN